MAIPFWVLLSVQAQGSPFDVYRAACLDTGADPARINALAKNWTALTEAERETLSPGNPNGLQGWAIIENGGRHLISIAASTSGHGEGGAVKISSCSVLTPKADETAALKAYSSFLKRPPSTQDKTDGISTYTWSIQGATLQSLHYLVAGGSLPGLSFSVSAIRK